MAKLHLSRIRKQGDPDWFDPATDIRKIIPQVATAVALTLEDEYDGRPEYEQTVYLYSCVKIFQIRLTEDKTPMATQLTEFLKALSGISAEIREKWYHRTVAAMLCVYALFCRRDSVTDGDSLRGMLEYTRLALLKDTLSPETWERVKKELDSSSPLLVQSRTTGNSSVVVEETGEIIDDVKRIACMFMTCSDNRDWNYLAELFDKGFNDSREKTDLQAASLALACPTYKYPTLTVEMDTGDELPDKAEESSGS